MARPRKWQDALNRLAAAEERFLTSEFLAPIVRGGVVHVRIAGIICQLHVQPADFEGWGVFQPTSPSQAKFLRPARLAERQRYLELFPLVRLILTRKREGQWWAVPAHRADGRFRIEGLVPVQLVDEADRFEVIETRFDSSHFWFAGLDPRWDPALAAYLRQALEQQQLVAQLHRPGLTMEERLAYALAWQDTEAARRDHEEERLRQALAHAGAEFKEYRERGDAYTVSFTVDGQRHTSVVAKNDLSVQVAGICLSGEDEHFDLQSLVGVIREAGGGVVRVGADNQGMAEEQYWHVHPPRPPQP